MIRCAACLILLPALASTGLATSSAASPRPTATAPGGHDA